MKSFIKCLSMLFNGRMWLLRAEKFAGFRANTNPLGRVDERRKQWDDFAKRLKCLLGVLIRDFGDKGVKIYMYDTSEQDVRLFEGKKYKNFCSIGVSSLNYYSGISYDEYKSGNKVAEGLVPRRTGEFCFSQAENGLVVVLFYSHIVEIMDNEKPPKFVCGFWEPNKLTDGKIKRLLCNGIDFMFNSYDYSRLNYSNRWLVFKTNRKYWVEGFMIGLVTSGLVALLIEIIKKFE